MQADKRDAGYLWDMLQAAQGVARAIQGLSFDQYIKDEDLHLAVERRIEIIGEAASRVSDIFRQTYSDIPWRHIIAQRNVIAHQYDEIDDELIWSVATLHVPALISNLKKLIPPPPPDPETQP